MGSVFRLVCPPSDIEVEPLEQIRDTIKPAPIDEEAKGLFDYTAFVDIE